MQAGKNDELIYFEQPQESNDFGSAQTSWVDASGDSPPTPDWAMIITQKGNEAFEAARQQSARTIRGRVRYRDDVKTTWRIMWNNEYYYINEIDRSKRRNGELWFTAEVLRAT